MFIDLIFKRLIQNKVSSLKYTGKILFGDSISLYDLSYKEYKINKRSDIGSVDQQMF